MKKDSILLSIQSKTSLSYSEVEQLYIKLNSYDNVLEINKLALKYNVNVNQLADFLRIGSHVNEAKQELQDNLEDLNEKLVLCINPNNTVVEIIKIEGSMENLRLNDKWTYTKINIDPEDIAYFPERVRVYLNRLPMVEVKEDA